MTANPFPTPTTPDRQPPQPPRIDVPARGRRAPEAAIPIAGMVEQAKGAARTAGERVVATGRGVRREADAVGGLQPVEAARLKKIDDTVEASVLEFLQKLDAARQELDRAKENVRFSESVVGKLDRRASARERKEGAKKILAAAQEAYQQLRTAALATGSGQRATRIHDARLKFAELEARLKGRDVTDEEAESLLAKKDGKTEQKALSRHDALRVDFARAKAEYLAIRAEVMAVHIGAFLHEQSALADAKAIADARAERGDATQVTLSAHQETVGEQLKATVEAGRIATYKLWQAVGFQTVKRMFGKGEERPVRVAIQDEMVGAASIADPEVGGIRIPARVGDVASALRSPDHSSTLSSEMLAELPVEDLDRFYREIYARAIVNGKKPEDMPGYGLLKAELARRNRDKAAYVADTAGGKEGFEYYAAIRGALREMVHTTNTTFSAAERNRRLAPRIPAVAGAMGAIALAFAAAPEFAHAQDTSTPAHTVEAAPHTDTVTVGTAELRSMYDSGITEAQKPLQIYSLVSSEMSASGDQTVVLEGLHMRFEEHDGKVTFYTPDNTAVDLGQIDTPYMGAYKIISEQVEKALTSSSGVEGRKVEAPVRVDVAAPAPAHVEAPEAVAEVDPDAPTVIEWHRVDHSAPTGLFADEDKAAAKAVGKKSVLEGIKSIDDGLDHILDVGGHIEVGGKNYGLPDDAAHNLSTEPSLTEAQKAEQDAQNAQLRAQYLQDAAAEAAVWNEPATLTPDARAEAHTDLSDGTLNLPNGMEVHFYSGKGANGVLEINFAKTMPKETALKAVLGSDYKQVISKLVSEYKEEATTTEGAITFVEYHAVRLASLLETRDYMVSHGLSDTKEFKFLKQQIEDTTQKVSKFGHVMYDDPFYGQPSGVQKADYYITWKTPHIDVVNKPKPGKEN